MSSGVEGGTTETSASLPDAKRSFTSWKLDLLTAINLDPKVRAVDMRFVVYLVQGLNERTRAFNVSDETAAEELHCNRARLTTGRARLEEVGWLVVRRGRGFADGSWYSFDDTAVGLHLRERDDRRADRKETRTERRKAKTQAALRCAEKSRHSAVSAPISAIQRCAEKTRHNVVSILPSVIERCAEETSHKTERCAEKTRHGCAEKTRHVHLTDTPISTALRSQDVAPEASDYATWDAEDWQALFDERAGVLEFDGGHSPADAERMAAEEVSGLRSSI